MSNTCWSASQSGDFRIPFSDLPGRWRLWEWGIWRRSHLFKQQFYGLWLWHDKFGWWKCLEVCEHGQGWDSTGTDSDGNWGPFWSKTKKHATIYMLGDKMHANMISRVISTFSRLKLRMNLLKPMNWHNLCLATVNLLNWGSPTKSDRHSVRGKAKGQDCGMVNVWVLNQKIGGFTHQIINFYRVGTLINHPFWG